MKTVKIMDFNVSIDGSMQIAELALDLVGKGGGHYMACLNPHSTVVSEKDSDFKLSLQRADILLPDGTGIVLAAKILGLDRFHRVAGMDFFEDLSRLSDKHGGIRYFFLGSTESVLEKIVNRISREYPHIQICGTLSPPFKSCFSDDDNHKIIQAINNAKPHILWVGMTAPKQEKWIYKNINKLEVPFSGAIGAVFDFYAGTKKRSPQWACKMGLEWLPRLMREPRRLFKRNFISNPLFLLLVFKNKLGFGKPS